MVAAGAGSDRPVPLECRKEVAFDAGVVMPGFQEDSMPRRRAGLLLVIAAFAAVLFPFFRPDWVFYRLVVVQGDRIPGSIHPGARHASASFLGGGGPDVRRALRQLAAGAAGRRPESVRASVR
jgi:hypothetical protein